MTHYDEHTIELYLLGDETLADQRAAIEAHIKECFSCRELAEELGQFHKLVHGTQTLLHEHVEMNRNTSLELKPEYTQRGDFRQVVPVMRSVPARVWHFARTRPVVSGVLACSVMGLLFFALNYRILPRNETSIRDTNPENLIPNKTTNRLEVLNKIDDVLLAIPIDDIGSISKFDQRHGVKQYILSDLNKDGIKELITTVGSPQNSWPSSLWVYDTLDASPKEIPFRVEQVKFSNTDYENPFSGSFIQEYESAVDKRKNIFISCSNIRSPYYLARLDVQLRVTAKYWHFGQLGLLYSVDIDNNGKIFLVLTGQNDTQDNIDGRGTPVIVILDPEKLSDESESSATRGFGHSVSSAEIFYIKLPDLRNLGKEGFSIPPAVFNQNSSHLPSFTILLDDEGEIAYTVLFTKEMRVEEIIPSSSARQFYYKLIKEGKYSVELDQYVSEIKKQIQYWDGRRWVNEPTRVKTPTQ